MVDTDSDEDDNKDVGNTAMANLIKTRTDLKEDKGGTKMLENITSS